MSKPVTNVAASVRQRLLNLARYRQEDFGLLLTKYALERLLFRLSQSEHKMTFILKGALLFELWTEQTHRPTRDADFLSIGSSAPRRFEELFKEICTLSVVVDDGLTFDASSVTARQIKEGADYEGVRVSFLGYLEKARIPMQLDIGFGDAVTPPAVEAAFPMLLDGPAAVLLTYPRETVVAEKFEADGEARHRQYPDEGLPRSVLPVSPLLIRGTDPLRSNRADIRASQDPTPVGTAHRLHGGVF
jgi:hypothetical protein